MAAALGASALPKDTLRLSTFARLDVVALAAKAVALGTVDIALNEGLINGWSAVTILSDGALAAMAHA